MSLTDKKRAEEYVRLHGKRVKIIYSGNPFGQRWVGREGIVTGESHQGLALEVMIDGERVVAFHHNVQLVEA